jgi:hypothetical protein
MATVNKPDDPEPRDLLGHLYDLWERDQETCGDKSNEVSLRFGKDWIRSFLVFARRKLEENQPVGTGFVEAGLAVRLQDHTMLPFVIGISQQLSTGGVGGCVPISKPNQIAAGGVAPGQSFDITGNKPPGSS